MLPLIYSTNCEFNNVVYDVNVYIYIYIYIYIQGDSGGTCNTLGNGSMCDSKQKSPYEHGSDFERLPKYGKKKIRTILRARTAIT